MEETQSTNALLLVRPAEFGFNEQAAETNGFMRPAQVLSHVEIKQRARSEFDGLVAALLDVGCKVVVVDDTPSPAKPDAVFPNNWFSTHADGTLVTYPMFAPARRLEREGDVLPLLQQRFGVSRTIALELYEERGVYLEGTGSLVLDRVNRKAYACKSARTDLALARRWCTLMNFTLVPFEAFDRDGLPIYHTNVVLGIGTDSAIVCVECISAAARPRVQRELASTGHVLVDISLDQVEHFAGNALEIVDGRGLRRWAMSSQAYSALLPSQRAVLEQHGPIVHAPIEAIEQLGGGSVRCMIAEVYLSPAV